MKFLLWTVALGTLFLSGCAPEPIVSYRVVQTAPPGLETEEIVRMAKAGLTDATIVEQIKSHGVRVRPTPDQIIALKQEGLSDPVLQAMSEAPVRSGQQVVKEIYGYPYYYPYYYPYGGAYYGINGSQSYSYQTSAGGADTAIQIALSRRGYYRGPIDGVIGPASEAAIRSFQTDNRLAVTGTVNRSLLQA